MISVCIATYNGERFIGEQIGSILPQLSEADEVIVSDDGSTDGTLDVIASFADSRIRVVCHQKQASKYSFDYTTRNFENAIRHSQGDIIFLADQDDVWLGNKLELMCQALANADLVLSDCKVVDCDLQTINPSYFSLNNSGIGLLHNLWRNSYLGNCMAFRRQILEYSLPIPPTLVPHDIWFGMNAEIHGKVALLNVPTLLYRRHGKNLSAASSTSDFSNIFRIYYRMVILINLIKRWFIVSKNRN